MKALCCSLIRREKIQNRPGRLSVVYVIKVTGFVFFMQMMLSCIYLPQYPVRPQFDTGTPDPFDIGDLEQRVIMHIERGFLEPDIDADIYGVSNDNIIFYYNNSSSYDTFFMGARQTAEITNIGKVRDIRVVDIMGKGEFNIFIAALGKDDNGDDIYETYGNIYYISSLHDFFTNNIETHAFHLTGGDSNGAPTLAFIDIDHDADYDAFIGSDHGDIFYFENIGTMTGPDFKYHETNPFNIINVGKYSIPSFADIDEDDDYDLFIGEKEGNIFYFENTGNRFTPNFSAPLKNTFGIAPVSSHAAPVFYDIDRDGDQDLYLGYTFEEEKGGIIYHKNMTF
jgi:hypothetical protein